MATFEVTDPTTGTTLELTGDSAPTEQELEQIFAVQPAQAAAAAPDQQIAQAGALPLQASQLEQQAPPQEPGILDRVEGAVRSVVEPALAVTTGALAEIPAGLAGLATLPFQGPKAAAETVEATRQRLTFRPTSEEGQAGLEAVGRAVEPVVEAVNIPLSGLTGLAELATGQGLGQAAETVGRVREEGFAKTIGQRTLEETGSPLVAAVAEAVPTAVLSRLGVKTKAGGAPDITPQRAREIQETLAASEAQGIDVLTSDIFQPKSISSRLFQQFAERVPVVGTGGKRAAQQRQRVDALDRLDQSTPRVESSDIVESLARSANKARVAAGNRINETVNNLDPIGTVPTTSAQISIDSAIAKLEKLGKLPNDALITELGAMKQALEEAPQSFKTLRDFRSDVRSIVDKVDPSGKSQLRSTDKALMDNVLKGITKDLDDFVLSNTDSRTLARYKRADKVYAQEAAKLTKSRLKTVLDRGDVKPELVNNLLFSSSPSEVRLLFNNLDSTGRQNARMALYRRALDNSTKGGEISPQRFVSELDKLGNNFNTFFRGQDRRELNGLKRLLDVTKRAAEARVVTPTGQAIQTLSTGAAGAGAVVGSPAAIAGVLGASTLSLATRVYESAGVREMLIRLGKAPKRSRLEADLLKSIPLALAEANQALTRQQETRQTQQ